MITLTGPAGKNIRWQHSAAATEAFHGLPGDSPETVKILFTRGALTVIFRQHTLHSPSPPHMKSFPLLTAPAAFVFLLAAGGAGAKSGPVVVSPGFMQGWNFEEDGAPAGTFAFGAGPAGKPQGGGSLQLATGAEQRSVLTTTAIAGARLKDLKKLGYSVLGTAAPVLQLEVDLDLKDTTPSSEAVLIYDPALNGTALPGAWQTWNAATGKWYLTGAGYAANLSAGQPFPQATPATLKEIIKRFPNAGVRAGTGRLLLKAGSDSGAASVALDTLTAGSTTWNFEPDTDGDTVPDINDRYPNSDLHTTVSVGAGDTGIANRVDQKGATIQDLVNKVALTASTGPKYIKGITGIAKDLQKSGLVTKAEGETLKAHAGQFVAYVDYLSATYYGGSSYEVWTNSAGISGNFGSLTPTGTGTLNLNQGAVAVNSGTLDLGASSSWAVTVGGRPSTGAAVAHSGALRLTPSTLQSGYLSASSGLVIQGPSSDLQLIQTGNASGSIIPGDNNALSISGGTGDALNAGTITLDPYPGISLSGGFTPVTLTAGAGNFFNVGTLDLNYNNSGFLAVQNNSPLILNDLPDTGTGGLIVNNANTPVLQGQNAFGAVLIVNGSNVQVIGTQGGGVATPVTGGMTVEQGTVSIAGSTGANPNHFSLVVNPGTTFEVRGPGSVTLTGVINNGTLRVKDGATLNTSEAANFVNNGILDLISGTATLPPNFTNGPDGIVLTRESVSVKSMALSAAAATLTIDSYTGHTYQLQHSATLNEGFTNTGAPQTGATGTTLTFTAQEDPAAPRGFYRIAVD